MTMSIGVRDAERLQRSAHATKALAKGVDQMDCEGAMNRVRPLSRTAR